MPRILYAHIEFRSAICRSERATTSINLPRVSDKSLLSVSVAECTYTYILNTKPCAMNDVSFFHSFSVISLRAADK